MDHHSSAVYQHAVNYLTEKKIVINNNILEYTCRYHHCVQHEFTTRRELFLELKKYFNLTTIGIIMQLISALKKGISGKAYPKYGVYLEALQYGEKQSKSEF